MSTDSTRQIVREVCNSYDNIRLIDNKDKYTPQAFNLGLKNAKGDYILLLGAHAYITDNYLQKAYDTIKAYNTACVGGRVVIISKSKIGKDIAFVLQSPFGVGTAKYRYSNKIEYVDTVAYGLYDKRIFDKIGYFDEELIRGQDYELNHRIIQLGEKMLYNPDFQSYWYARPSIKKLFSQQYYNGFWKVLAQLKRKNIASYRHIIPGLFALAIIFLAILSFINLLFFGALIVLLSVYTICSLFFIKADSNKNRRVWLLPALFFILHMSYGLGYIVGAFYFPFKRLFSKA